MTIFSNNSAKNYINGNEMIYLLSNRQKPMRTKPVNYHLDNTDFRILQLLVKDARITYTEIAKKLFVSPGTVHVRMKKMEKLKIPLRYQLIVDYSKLGYDITAFLGVYLERNSLYTE